MDQTRCFDMQEPKSRCKQVSYPEITEFTISARPIDLAADHAYISFEVKDECTRDVYAKIDTKLAKYQFTLETVNLYNCGVYNSILKLVPSTPR